MGYNFSPKIVTDNLVLYLDAANTRSYPGSGTLWSDLTKNNNNGTLTNGPTFDNGNYGSIVFDGSNDYASCGTGNTLNISNYITLEAWINPKGDGTQNVICKSGPLGGCYIYPRTDNGWTGSHFYLSIGGWTVLSATWPGKNIWTHTAATYDGSNMIIYINGFSATSKTQTGSIRTVPEVDLTIGNQPGGFPEYFNGNLEIVRIYNRALSATEVLQNYNANKGRFGL